MRFIVLVLLQFSTQTNTFERRMGGQKYHTLLFTKILQRESFAFVDGRESSWGEVRDCTDAH